MLPFLPAGAQRWIHVMLAAAVAVFVVLKSDQTLGAIPWVVAVGSFLSMLNSIFTASPSQEKEHAELADRVAKLSSRLGGGAGVAVLAFFLGTSQPACKGSIGPVPQPVIDDFAGLVECVASNLTDWQAMVMKCSSWSIGEIESAIQWLLASHKMSAEHPEWADALKARLVDVRVRRGEMGGS